MSLSADERKTLEIRLTGTLRNLINRADNAPLANTLKARDIHVTQLRIVLDEPELPETPDQMRERRDRERREWERLFVLTRSYKWDDFVLAVSQKLDVTKAWKQQLCDLIGIRLSDLQSHERMGLAKYDWLTTVAALPNRKAEPDFRSNFSEIAGELADALRSAGKSPSWIAKAFNDFLRDFNGTSVSTADVTRTHK